MKSLIRSGETVGLALGLCNASGPIAFVIHESTVQHSDKQCIHCKNQIVVLANYLVITVACLSFPC